MGTRSTGGGAMSGEEMAKLRRAAGVSRDALALAMGYTYKTVYRKERGFSEITKTEAEFMTGMLRPKRKAKRTAA